MLAILKALAIVLTSVFGVIGLLVEFKDKTTNRVTRGGKLILAGIGVTATLSLVMLVLEERSSQQKDDRLFSELEKAQTKFTTVSGRFEIKLPVHHPALADYGNRIRSQFSSDKKVSITDLAQLSAEPREAETIAYEFIRNNTLPSQISIHTASPEKGGRLLLRPDTASSPVVNYDKTPFALTASHQQFSLAFESFGSFVSITDLAGKVLEIRYGQRRRIAAIGTAASEVARLADEDAVLRRLTGELDTPKLELKFDNRTFAFSNFKKIIENDSVIFSTTIPRDLSEIETR